MSYIIVFWVNAENFSLKNQFPILITYTVAGPDLQIKGGFCHPDPVIRGRERGGLKKSFFSPSGLSLVKIIIIIILIIIRGRAPRALPLDPPLIYNGKKQVLCFIVRSLNAKYRPDRYSI